MPKPYAVIIGAGGGLSAAVAREFSKDHELVLAARGGAQMREVADELGARTVLLMARMNMRSRPFLMSCLSRRVLWSIIRLHASKAR